MLKIGNLEIRIPIIQGGMGVGVSLSGLAAAVANEGGVGTISCAGLGLLYRSAASDFKEACIAGLKEELRKVREKTKGVIGVNVMVAMTNFADMVKTAIAEKTDIIFSGAGLPLDLPSFLKKDSTTKLVPIVSSARAVKVICEKWKTHYNYLPDAIVVEGPKAGGHLGYKLEQINDPHYSLEELLPAIIKEVKLVEEKYDKVIPVIAAGGIYTGADMLRMMNMGAAGVQLGTRFVTTEECDANIEFKNTYIRAQEKDVVLIKSPVGMPGRAVDNEFIHRVNAGEAHPNKCAFHCIKTCDVETTPYCIMNALYSAVRGKMNHGYAFAGVNAWRATKITTVKEVMESIMTEAASLKEAQPA